MVHDRHHHPVCRGGRRPRRHDRHRLRRRASRPTQVHWETVAGRHGEKRHVDGSATHPPTRPGVYDALARETTSDDYQREEAIRR